MAQMNTDEEGMRFEIGRVVLDPVHSLLSVVIFFIRSWLSSSPSRSSVNRRGHSAGLRQLLAEVGLHQVHPELVDQRQAAVRAVVRHDDHRAVDIRHQIDC